MSLLAMTNARGALQLAWETVGSWRASTDEVAWNRCAESDSVLLLHGFAGTPRMLYAMRKYLLRELHRPAIDVALGVGIGDIRDMAIRVEGELSDRGIRRCDVVGYSMGGLVATYLAKCLDQGRRIRRVVTIGTPHRGVPGLSEWWWPLARWCRSARQMREGSTFLEQLMRIPPAPGTTFLSIAGSEDPIVPPHSAHLDGTECRNLVVPGLDHWTLPTSRCVFRCVREVLESARGRLPAPQLTEPPR